MILMIPLMIPHFPEVGSPSSIIDDTFIICTYILKTEEKRPKNFKKTIEKLMILMIPLANAIGSRERKAVGLFVVLPGT